MDNDVDRRGNKSIDTDSLAQEDDRAEQRAKLFLPVGEKVNGFIINEDEEDGPQLVEEIESLCMNCEKNVSTPWCPGRRSL